MDKRFTEGICGDGAAILDNGKQITITEILNNLNRLDKLEQLRIGGVVQQSELYTCECKVCGKPFGDKLSLYEHYDEEHN